MACNVYYNQLFQKVKNVIALEVNGTISSITFVY